jgi:hypothetical protein
MSSCTSWSLKHKHPCQVGLALPLLRAAHILRVCREVAAALWSLPTDSQAALLAALAAGQAHVITTLPSTGALHRDLHMLRRCNHGLPSEARIAIARMQKAMLNAHMQVSGGSALRSSRRSS